MFEPPSYCWSRLRRGNKREVQRCIGLPQRTLFGPDVRPPAVPPSVAASFPRATTSLHELVAAELKFRTIYTDPPWDYDNRASRGAARNHYRTMTLEQIRTETVSD